MPQASKKPKKKSMYAKIFGAPSGPAKAEAKDDRPSIAERINFGGNFPDKKKQPKRKGY